MEITIEVPDQLGQQLKNMPDFKQFAVNALQRAIQERPQKTKKTQWFKEGDMSVFQTPFHSVTPKPGSRLASEIIVENRKP